MYATNVELPIRLCKTLMKMGGESFIQLGSMSEYDNLPEQMPISETHITSKDANQYGGSKALATRGLMELETENEPLNIIVLRLFGVFGAKEAPHRLLPSLYKGLAANKNVPMSHGLQIRDFVYIKDVVDAISASLALSRTSHSMKDIINIGSGRPLSVKDFAIAFCKANGFEENLLKFGSLPQRDTDVAFIQSDISKAKALLTWSPKWDLKAAFSDYLKEKTQS